MTPQDLPCVVIDALSARFGGAAYAAPLVAKRLSERPEVRQVVLLTGGNQRVRAETILEGRRLSVLELGHSGPLELARRVVWEALALPRLLERRRAALHHWSGTLP